MHIQVTDNGGYGLTMSLREEGPKDEIRVRSINNWNLTSRTEPLDLGSKEVKRIFEHDMLVNCFRDGKWGTMQAIAVPTGTYYARKCFVKIFGLQNLKLHISFLFLLLFI